jgi:hypothetical protein
MTKVKKEKAILEKGYGSAFFFPSPPSAFDKSDLTHSSGALCKGISLISE